jgi:hypothetical protein
VRKEIKRKSLKYEISLFRSSIQYADDGKWMIVEWQQMTLMRDSRPAGRPEAINVHVHVQRDFPFSVGPFTFQVHLWHNGNITFVYKEVYKEEAV